MVDVAHQEQSRWKTKYLDALDAHEGLEKSAGSRVDELATLVARLSRGLPGANATAARERLSKLTDALKRKPFDARLSRDIKEAHARVIDVMEAHDREHAEVVALLGQSADALEPRCGQRAFKRRLKQFKASLARREAPATSELLSNLNALQTQVLDNAQVVAANHDPAARDDDPPAARNDRRANARDDETANARDDETANARDDETANARDGSTANARDEPPLRSSADNHHPQESALAAAVAASSSVANGAPQHNGQSAGVVDWPAVRQVLAMLVQRADMPPQFKPQVEHITAVLGEEMSDEHLLDVLEQIRDLFDAALTAMDVEFRDFLDSVDQRLDGLLSALGQAHEEERSAMSRELGLRDTFSASLTAMRNDAACATDLTQLKSSIDGHLECLVRSVQDINDESRSAGAQRDARLAAMTSRLRELESESAQARTQLETQRQLARTDSLTRLANRKAFDERIAAEIDDAQRGGSELAMAIADIDHFKNVNDTWGHSAGDRALALFARILKSRTRDSDFCARFGGEEFVMLFPATRAEMAAKVVEQVREYVENCGFSYKGEPVALTASFGVTQYRDGDNALSMLERADAAMYEAKSGGRNQVRLSVG